MRSYSNFIGGEWVAARTGQNYQNFNAADTREFVAQYPRSGKEEAGEAVQAAQKAWPAWAAMTPVARGRILGKASKILETRKAELAELLTREEGKTLAESAGEVQRAIDIFRFFSGLSYTLGGQTLHHDLPGNLLFTVRQPLGAVGLITPRNFPMAIPAWKMAPALVCGNAVVIKPASQAPAPTLELAKALHEAGRPLGVLNVVVGEGRPVGGELAANPAVVALSFTGSYTVGRQIYEQLAGRMARGQMEMGGKNPTIVLADADLDLAASLVSRAGFGLTDQACTTPSRVILGQPELEPFMEVENVEGALAVVNGVDVRLSASIVTRDLKKAMLYAERIEAGVVKINQVSTGLALQAPFGGVKKSSTDSFKEQGAGAIEFYSKIKTVYLDYSA